MPLPEIRELLHTGDPQRVKTLIARHQHRLAGQLADAQRRLALIERLIVEGHAMLNEVTEVKLPAVRVASRHVQGAQTMQGPLVTVALIELWRQLERQGMEPIATPLILVHHGDEERFEQEVCFVVDESAHLSDDVHVRTLDPVDAAVTRHTGPMEDANLLVHSLAAWIGGRGHEATMPFRVTFLAAPPLFAAPEVADSSQPVYEIAIPYTTKRSA